MKKVWCLFEESEHSDPYDSGCDGTNLVGLFESYDSAFAEMNRLFDGVGASDADTVDKSRCRIELSKWSVKDGKYEHVCDWRWWLEEMEVSK